MPGSSSWSKQSLWASAFPTHKQAILPFWNMVPSIQSSLFWEISTPHLISSWFFFCLHNHCSFFSSGSPQVHQCPEHQACSRGLCMNQDRTQGHPDSWQLPSRKPCSQTLLFQSFLRHSFPQLQAEGRWFFCLVFSLGFWFSFCGSALPRFVYQHQSWNQLCLFVDLSFPWNLWIFLGHSVFLIIEKVVHMATKEGLGSKTSNPKRPLSSPVLGPDDWE